MATREIPTPNPDDVASIDGIIAAVYDGISGPAGRKRDWNRERSLFVSGARLIPPSMQAGSTARDTASPLPVLDLDGFISRVEPHFEKNGFYEKEVTRKTERFGNIAHIWSTYESRYDESDPEPFMRGINSIQLYWDGKRWWIVTIYWQHESAEHPIPPEYLP